MKTIGDELIEAMDSNGVHIFDTSAEDFMEGMRDFLIVYIDHLKIAEPQATKTIRQLEEVRFSLGCIDFNELIQG